MNASANASEKKTNRIEQHATSPNRKWPNGPVDTVHIADIRARHAVGRVVVRYLKANKMGMHAMTCLAVTIGWNPGG
jgi:hypothetical protein